MVGEATGVVLCLLLWGARAFLAAKYQVKYRVAGEIRWAWKRGTTSKLLMLSSLAVSDLLDDIWSGGMPCA